MIRYYIARFRWPLCIAVISLGAVNLIETILPVLLKRAFDTIQFGGPAHELGTVAMLYLGCAGIQVLCRLGWRLTVTASGVRVAHDLRMRVANHLTRLSEKQLKGKTVGEQMALCSSDVDAVKGIIDPGTVVICDSIFNVFFFPVAMYLLSPSLTLITCAPAVLIPLVARRFQKSIGFRFARVQESVAILAARVYQDLSGVRIIKSFAREEQFLRRFAAISKEYAGRIVHCAKVESLFSPTIEGIAVFGVLLCLVYAAPQVIDQTLSIGTLVAFQQYIRKMMWPLQAVGIGVTLYQKASTSAARLEEILAMPIEDLDSGEALSPGAIEFKSVSFRYSETDQNVLSGVSFRIEPGERVAVLGETGAGKSTLFSLLLRVFEPTEGEIFVGGRPIRGCSLSSVRSSIRLSPQEPFLYSGSIARNIPGTATAEVLRRSALDRDLSILPAGLNTDAGERGKALSGGQRQRVGLARALVGDPPVLLLDDPFSSLDPATAAQVARELSKLPSSRTIIFTTQRLSAIKLATRIFVLRHGTLVQSGTHDELIGQDGWYAEFVRHGRLEEALDAA